MKRLGVVLIALGLMVSAHNLASADDEQAVSNCGKVNGECRQSSCTGMTCYIDNPACPFSPC